VKLAQELQDREHDISWISLGEQVDRLQKAGFDVENQPAISGLCVLPFIKVNDIALKQSLHKGRIDSIAHIKSLIENRQPDVLLVDRLLTYMAIIAAELDIPYVAIGTSGGPWSFEIHNQDIHVAPGSAPKSVYRDYAQHIKKDLGWTQGDIDSFWLDSPHLNINFINKQFYGISNSQEKMLASVFHHRNNPPEKAGQYLGVSFGNQGQQKPLLDFLICAIAGKTLKLPIDVFVGNNKQIYEILKQKYSCDEITIHRWVDFSDYFDRLSCLVFLGGIGTIWECIEHGTPMLIVPGNMGDQRFNAERIQSLGIGKHIHANDITIDGVNLILEHCNSRDEYRNNLLSIRTLDNYTDTMSSVCNRIEGFLK